MAGTQASPPPPAEYDSTVDYPVIALHGTEETHPDTTTPNQETGVAHCKSLPREPSPSTEPPLPAPPEKTDGGMPCPLTPPRASAQAAVLPSRTKRKATRPKEPLCLDSLRIFDRDFTPLDVVDLAQLMRLYRPGCHACRYTDGPVTFPATACIQFAGFCSSGKSSFINGVNAALLDLDEYTTELRVGSPTEAGTLATGFLPFRVEDKPGAPVNIMNLDTVGLGLEDPLELQGEKVFSCFDGKARFDQAFRSASSPTFLAHPDIPGFKRCHHLVLVAPGNDGTKFKAILQLRQHMIERYQVESQILITHAETADPNLPKVPDSVFVENPLPFSDTTDEQNKELLIAFLRILHVAERRMAARIKHPNCMTRLRAWWRPSPVAPKLAPSPPVVAPTMTAQPGVPQIVAAQYGPVQFVPPATSSPITVTHLLVGIMLAAIVFFALQGTPR